MTSRTLVIWLLSRSDNDTRMLCSDGFGWSTSSGMNCQWYGHWKKLIKIPCSTDYYYCINHMTCSIHVYYCSFILATLFTIVSTIMSISTLHFLHSSHTRYPCIHILCISCISYFMCFLHISMLILCTSCIHVHIIHIIHDTIILFY